MIATGDFNSYLQSQNDKIETLKELIRDLLMELNKFENVDKYMSRFLEEVAS